jgi:hypothetical protein
MDTGEALSLATAVMESRVNNDSWTLNAQATGNALVPGFKLPNARGMELRSSGLN